MVRGHVDAAWAVMAYAAMHMAGVCVTWGCKVWRRWVAGWLGLAASWRLVITHKTVLVVVL
jgi:hypothetical protein